MTDKDSSGNSNGKQPRDSDPKCAEKELKDYISLKDIGWNTILKSWIIFIRIVAKFRKQILYGSSTEDRNISSVLSYRDFKMLKNAVPEIFREYICPSFYIKFTRDDAGNIHSGKFVDEVLKSVYMKYMNGILSSFISDIDGSFNKKSFKLLVSNWLTNKDGQNDALLLLEKVEADYPGMIKFYQSYISNRFLFLLDTRNTGYVSLQSILENDELKDFTEACAVDDVNLQNYWSPMYVSIIFSKLCSNGIKDTTIESVSRLFKCLSTEIGRSCFHVTENFFRRLFEQGSTKEFLIESSESQKKIVLTNKGLFRTLFCLESIQIAVDKFNKDPTLTTHQCQKFSKALYWAWSILDVDNKGSINASTVEYFWEDISRNVKEINPDILPEKTQIFDQLFDLIPPPSNEWRIFRKQFVSHIQEASTFFLLLVNHIFLLQFLGQDQPMYY